jgi:hypothetical protein
MDEENRKSFVLEDLNGNALITFKASTPRAAALKAARRGHGYIRLRECKRLVKAGARIHVFFGKDPQIDRDKYNNVEKKGVVHARKFGLVDLDSGGVRIIEN